MRLVSTALVCVAASIILPACTSVFEPSRVMADIETTHQDIETKPIFDEKKRYIREFNRVYVKQLTEDEASKPSWFRQRSGVALNAGFRDAISELMAAWPINIEYRDGIGDDKHVLVDDPNLTVGQVIEYVSASTGYSYDIVGNTLVWSKYVTEIFEIRQLPGKESYMVGSQGGGQTSSGSSGNSGTNDKGLFMSDNSEFASMSGDIDTLQEAKDTIDAILGCGSPDLLLQQTMKARELTGSTSGSGMSGANSSGGGKDREYCEENSTAEIIRSTSSVMVKAVPSQLEAVRAYVKKKNAMLTRQVVIDIKLIEVEFEDQAQSGFDIDAINTMFRGWGNVSLSTTARDGVIGGLDPRGVFQIETTNLPEGVNPSKLFIEALEAQGAVASTTYPRIVGVNNRVSKVGVVQRTNYISDRPLQTIANAGAAAGIEQRTAETGYVLNILPSIGEGEVMVKISTSNSTLLELETKGEAGREVESPNIKDKFFNTTLRLEPGKPLILAGLSDDRSQSKNSLSMVGWFNSSTKTNSETMLMIEARIF